MVLDLVIRINLLWITFVYLLYKSNSTIFILSCPVLLHLVVTLHEVKQRN